MEAPREACNFVSCGNVSMNYVVSFLGVICISAGFVFHCVSAVFALARTTGCLPSLPTRFFREMYLMVHASSCATRPEPMPYSNPNQPVYLVRVGRAEIYAVGAVAKSNVLCVLGSPRQNRPRPENMF